MVEEKVSRLKSGVTDVEVETHRVIKPDGGIGWQEWTDQAIRDEAGQVIEFQSVGRDITESKLAENALKQSEERFSKAFMTSPVIICLVHIRSGQLLEVNEAFEKIIGYTREEAVGRTTAELGIWENRADRDRIVPILLAHGKIKNEEFRFRTKSGNIIICNYAGERIDLDGEECVIAVIEDITERKKAEAALRESQERHRALNQDLECRVAEATRDLGAALAELQQTYQATLEALGSALATREIGTELHSRRVHAYSLALARAHRLPEPELEALGRGVLLHDIGKIGISDAILLKPGPLTPEEWAMMRRHPEVGRQLLERIPFLRDAIPVVYHHHERWDGTGYPLGLAGPAIPLGARIIAVGDAFDAMTTRRPYRPARPWSEAVAELQRCAGASFSISRRVSFFIPFSP